MIVYNPYSSWKGRWQAAIGSLRYGFWWGMDFDAYIFLISLVLVTIPALWFDTYHQYEDVIRIIELTIYSCVIYAAFAGKMIFYKHFHDTYNYMVHYGNHAEKRNLIDIFFNQDRGALVLLGFIPIAIASWYMGTLFLSLPSIPYPESYLTDTWMIVGWNILLVALSVISSSLVLLCQIYARWKPFTNTRYALNTLLPKRMLMMPYTVLFPVNIKIRGNNSIILYMLLKKWLKGQRLRNLNIFSLLLVKVFLSGP